jgi:hypothetical protein
MVLITKKPGQVGAVEVLLTDPTFVSLTAGELAHLLEIVQNIRHVTVFQEVRELRLEVGIRSAAPDLFAARELDQFRAPTAIENQLITRLATRFR